MATPYITVEPMQCMNDKPWRLSAHALKPHSPYTLASSCKHDVGAAKTFVAYAHYVSDEFGTIDVNHLASMGGTYRGIEPMGLMWSIKASRAGDVIDIYSQTYNEAVFMKRDVTTPVDVSITLHSGHVAIETADDQQTAVSLAQCTARRLYMHPNTKRIAVRQGRLRGTIFIPEGKGPFPAVLDIYGGGGGIQEARAALLSSNGFVTYALPHYAFDDLPERLELDMEYFIEAVDYLTSLPEVNSRKGVGVLGLCFGGTIAMQLALLCSKVRAVVNVCGSSYLTGGWVEYKGQPLPSYAEFDNMKHTPQGIEFAKVYPAISELCLPIERATWCRFLFINGEDDRAIRWEHGRNLHERCAAIPGKSRHIVYPNAGHMIDPPNTPPNQSRWLKGLKVALNYGGTLEGHAHAQEQSWREILAFFARELALDTKL